MSKQRKHFELTASDVQSFARCSHDRNPLHLDSLYARKTPFGQRVAFGILAFLKSLKQIAPDSIAIKTLDLEFKKPCFEDTPYEIEYEVAQGELRASVLQSKLLILKYKLSFESVAPNLQEIPVPSETFTPVLVPQDIEAQSGSLHYTAGTPFESFANIPPQQQSVLMWSSYFTGMCVPGTQALYGRLKLTFKPESIRPSIELKGEWKTHWEPRFSMVRTTVQTDWTDSFEITAFKRPKPINVMDPGRWELATSKPTLAKRRFLVTGSTRGFGAAIGCAMLHQGATVIFSGRSQPSDNMLAGWDSELKKRAEFFPWDLQQASPDVPLNEPLDGLVLNAITLIPHRRMEEAGADWGTFVDKNLKMTVHSIEGALPHLTKGAVIALVSTTYLDSPAPGFSEYCALKSAQEGLIKALRAERPEFRYLIMRFPKMLTDQTNGLMADPTIEDPTKLAIQLVDKISSRFTEGF